jgi:integrase
VQTRGFGAARDFAELPETQTCHDLRHAFASLCQHRGVPIQVLSEALGHAHVGIAQAVYVHMYARDKAEADFRAAMTAGV